MSSTSTNEGNGAQEVCLDCAPNEAPALASAASQQDKKAKAAENILDRATFVPPLDGLAPQLPTPTIVIEFCHRCRFFHRASWIQTELWMTFPPDESKTLEAAPAAPTPATDTSGETATTATDKPGGTINAIFLVPRTSQEKGGRFRIWINTGEKDGQADGTKAQDWDLVWDRKTDGGFPELRKLKQLIRDRIAPGAGLGHSDKKVASASS